MGIRTIYRSMTSPFRGLTLREIWSGVILYGPENLRDLWTHQRDRFDEQYGTDTTKAVAVADLNPIAASSIGAVMYWPTSSGALKSVLEVVGDRVRGFTFADIGAGKGRALMLAADHGFGRVVGVEFSPELCRVARENIEIFHRAHAAAPAMTIECVDATAWQPPIEPLFLYLFDPFGEAVMSRFVENLKTSLSTHPRPCFVAYLLPTQRRQFEQRGFRVVAELRRNWHFKYPWVLFELSA